MTTPDTTRGAAQDTPGPDARGRYAYALEPYAAQRVHRQVSRIMMFDHAAGAQATADAEPCDVLYVTRAGGLGLDRQVSGFLPPVGPLATPDGLVYASQSAARLVPDPGAPGDRWRDIVRRLEERPRLGLTLAALGIPVCSHSPIGGFARARLVLDPADTDAPVMIGYKSAPAGAWPSSLRPVPVWHFEMALEVLRGVADAPGAPLRPMSTDRRVAW